MRPRTTSIAAVPARGKEAQTLPPPKCVEYLPLSQITEDIARPLEARPGKGWWACFAFAFAGLMLFGLAVSRTYIKGIDRKSTRLNSSHANISYAVFCLKKKKK